MNKLLKAAMLTVVALLSVDQLRAADATNRTIYIQDETPIVVVHAPAKIVTEGYDDMYLTEGTLFFKNVDEADKTKG